MFSRQTISLTSLPVGGESRFYYLDELSNSFVGVEPTKTFFDTSNAGKG